MTNHKFQNKSHKKKLFYELCIRYKNERKYRKTILKKARRIYYNKFVENVKVLF